ncbi:MAG TPA: LLM class flavin-dependent oxidoreductase [Candidatus Limnocylindrales bacterium]|nr:LLM class flavin-dependent oxidoreductase [Candidatus Limnocylindrales bacterium]
MSRPDPTARPTLRLGVQLPEVEYVVRWPDLVAMARRAEAIGLDALWLGDHLLYRGFGPDRTEARGPWEAWTTLAGLAAVTSRIRLGPLVAATAFHAPPMLAKMAATVDEISGGRLVLGLGAGWNETEFSAFGFPFDHRVARFEEAFTIVRTLLRDGAIDFEGTYYRARDCELLPRPRAGGPPLLIGSNGPRMLRATLPYVDAWNSWFADTGNTPDGARRLNAMIDAACREVDRDPSTLRRSVAVLVRLTGGLGRAHADPEAAAMPPLTGSAEEIAAGLLAYAEVGIDEVQLVLDPITEASIAELTPVVELVRSAARA